VKAARTMRSVAREAQVTPLSEMPEGVPGKPFTPSLVPGRSETDLFHSLAGAAGRFLVENPRVTSPRALVDLWNAFRHRNRSLALDDFGFDEEAAKVWQPLFEFLYTVWWRVTMTGVENIPSETRALLVANHSGVMPWDGGMLKFGIGREHPARRQARLLILDMFTTLPFLQPWLRHLGEVRACPENGERLLQRDEVVGVFPEGVKGIGKLYRDRYRLARFGRGGFVRLALRTRSPIIPVSIVGAEEIHPNLVRLDFIGRPFGLPYFPATPTFPLLGPLGVVPLPTKWWIDIGKPIAFDHGPEVADRPMIVHELADKVRTTLQTMIDSRLSRRGNIFTGE
jgi:1-acyl-sn-glycerol-3-phosphate acyltransferase